MIEKFNIDLHQSVSVNAALFNCEYLTDPTNKSQKVIENKENYLQVECPITILAAIGGDIDIYKYLLDRGVNSSGSAHIGLSRKLKNSVISNVIGASAFYGRINLLHYILEKTRSSNRLDINQKTIEKKSKTKQFSLQKEFADFTPIHLALVNDFISEDDSIEVMKLLYRYKCDMNAVDWNKNNILHLAVKFNKKRIVKYIMEDFKFLDMNEVANKDGQTPVAIAKTIESNYLFNYLQGFSKSSEAVGDLEEELLELIESTGNKNKKKNKKDKKKKGEDLGVIGTTNEFQETLKPPKEKLVEPPKQEEAKNAPAKSKEKEENSNGNEEDQFSEENAGEEKDTSISTKQYYERKSYYTNYGDNKMKKNYQYGYNTTNSTGYRKNPNYSNRSYEKDYDDYDYSNKTYKKHDYGYSSYSYNTYGDEKKYGKYSQNKGYKSKSSVDYEAQALPVTSTSSATAIPATLTTTATTAPAQSQVLITDNIDKQQVRKTGIVGLSSKHEKKIGKIHEKERDKELSKEQLKEISPTETEKHVLEKLEKIPVIEIRPIIEQTEISIEKSHEVKSEDILANISQTSKDDNKNLDNIEPQSAKYEIKKIEEHDHENEEDYLGDENFITDELVEDKDHDDEIEHRQDNKQELIVSENKHIKEEPALTEEKIPTQITAIVETEIKPAKAETHHIIQPVHSETTEKELKELTVLII